MRKQILSTSTQMKEKHGNLCQMLKPMAKSSEKIETEEKIMNKNRK